VLGAAVYGLMALLLRSAEVQPMLALLRRRLLRPAR
jgi:hypothetical protein